GHVVRRDPGRRGGSARLSAWHVRFTGARVRDRRVHAPRRSKRRRVHVDRGGLGKNAGFVAGWLYAGGWMFATAVVLALSAVNLNAFFLEVANADINWFIFFIVLLVIAAGLTMYGVQLSLRVQLGLE